MSAPLSLQLQPSTLKLPSSPSLSTSSLSRDVVFLYPYGPCDRCSVPLRRCRCRRSPLVLHSLDLYFDRPTNPQPTAKRQTEVPSQGGGNPFDAIIQNITAGFNGSFGVGFPLNVNATYGLGDGGSNPFSAIFQQLIPSAFNGLAGPGNNVSLTGVSGQPPFFFGLGFSPANGTSPGGFDFSSIFSGISGPFSDILSSFLGGTNVTTFPISFPGAGNSSFGGGFPTIPDQNATLPGSNDTSRPFPPFDTILPFPVSNGTTPSFPGAPNATVPSESGNMTALPVPTFNPTALPFPIPSDVVSSIEVELSSIVVSISDASLPVGTVVPSSPASVSSLLPTDVSTSIPAIPTETA